MLISNFVERLAKIGIKVTLVGNYPWVYLNTINDRKVIERFQANHGFTAFFMHPTTHFSDRREVFKLIRKYTKT